MNNLNKYKLAKLYKMDSSYSNIGDRDAKKYMEAYLDVSEDDIHQEIINLMWNHPLVYKEYKARLEAFVES